MSPFLPFSSAVFLFSSHYLLIRRIALATVMSGLSQFGYNALMSCLLGRVFGWKGVWLGFALSYLLGLLSGLLYIRLRHGKEMVPWMLPHNEHPTHSISLYFNEASVLSVRDEMGMFLGGCGVPSGCISASMLAIEECGMNIADRNPGKDIVGEYTVTADGENVVMYIRDSGVLFDMSDPDNRIDSFRSYVISSFMERHSDRRYLVTLSNNRLMLSVPYGASAGNHLKE